MSAIKDGQAHTEHGGEEEEEKDETDLSKLVIMPPGMKLKPCKLSCCVYRCTHLPQMVSCSPDYSRSESEQDVLGWCDGFIKMKFGAEISTEVSPESCADPVSMADGSLF